MNIAVCISSRLRGVWKITLPKIKLYFDQLNINVDYFLHTSNINVDRYTLWGESYTNFISNNDINEIKKILNPKKIYVEENYKDINLLLNTIPTTININTFKQDNYYNIYPIFSMEQCNNLKNEYSASQNIKYNVVYKIRPDIFFIDNTPINIILEHYKNLNQLLYVAEQKDNRIADLMFYSNNNIMNQLLINASYRMINSNLESRAEVGLYNLSQISNISIEDKYKFINVDVMRNWKEK
jgi:hypothetical protein